MREQKDINVLVGRIGDEYYICDHVFKYDDDFKGAVATVLYPVSKEAYEDAQSPGRLEEWFEDCWRESVKAGTTTESLADFAQDVFKYDGDEALFDFSGYEYWDLIRQAKPELTEDDYPVMDCTGGGRSFYLDMKWDELFAPDVWEIIQKYESKED